MVRLRVGFEDNATQIFALLQHLVALGVGAGGQVVLVGLAVAGLGLLEEGGGLVRASLVAAHGGLELQQPRLHQQVAGAVAQADGGFAQRLLGSGEVAGPQAGLAETGPGAGFQVLHDGGAMQRLVEPARRGQHQARQPAGLGRVHLLGGQAALEKDLAHSPGVVAWIALQLLHLLPGGQREQPGAEPGRFGALAVERRLRADEPLQKAVPAAVLPSGRSQGWSSGAPPCRVVIGHSFPPFPTRVRGKGQKRDVLGKDDPQVCRRAAVGPWWTVPSRVSSAPAKTSFCGSKTRLPSLTISVRSARTFLA